MANEPHEIAELIARSLNGPLNEEEQYRLNAWRLANEEHQQLFEKFKDNKWIAAELSVLYEYDKEAMRKKLAQSIAPSSKFKYIIMKNWPAYAAAASILILISVGYWWLSKPKKQSVTQEVSRFKNDVLPANDQSAVLMLEDGRKIYLDQVQDGSVTQQGNVQIVKRGKELTYASAVGTRQSAVTYNTLSTPKGKQYQVVLPDNSKVWLNAASSIRYPTAFTGNERKVEITGEAFFEVSTLRLRSGQKMPFRVTIVAGAVRGEVEVLGTHFNVNAYENEEVVKTTLVEGKVKVSSMVNGQGAMLKPGQQASLSKASQSIPVQIVDVEGIVAWKNNFFVFNDLTIQAVMRQLARWYDVEVVYEGQVPEHFNATIQRNVPLSKVLQVLELTESVKFEIDGKRVVVKN
jgi:transmembrane sensor